jgi:hypothetical protein
MLIAAAGLLAAACATTSPPHPNQTAATPASSYTAFGGGHVLRNISADGRYLTLEDGSRWEVGAADRFQTADWEADAAMTVSASHGENGFDYHLLNTTADESVAARFIPRD